MIKKFIRDNWFWIIGGLAGFLYFSVTYYIDIGRCHIHGIPYCSGATGLIFMFFNFPAAYISSALGLGFYGMAAADFGFGALAGLVIYNIFKYIKR